MRLVLYEDMNPLPAQVQNKFLNPIKYMWKGSKLFEVFSPLLHSNQSSFSAQYLILMKMV